MKKSLIIIIVILIIIVIGGIYWFTQSSNAVSSTSDTTGTPSTQTTAVPTLSSGSSATLGTYLEATTNGMTLYTYQNDSAGTSTCSGTCATTWPPYTVASASDLTPDPSMTGTLGTITRDDGTLQVTYNGMPLYFYSGDTNPGDTTGDGVDAVWSIAHP